MNREITPKMPLNVAINILQKKKKIPHIYSMNTKTRAQHSALFTDLSWE